MRLLLAAMRYPTGPGESYLTSELADALVDAGHEVQVLHLDWEAPASGPIRELRGARGQRVVRCTPRWLEGAGMLVRHASKFLLSGRHAARVARNRFDLASFDALVMWMPATAFGPLVRQCARAGIRNRMLIIWDFFPDHYREIGRIPVRPVYAMARALEQRLLEHFTAVFCTLPGNADYLRRNYAIRQDQNVVVTPVWGETAPLPPVDRASARRRHQLPADAPIAVFGGQLVAGRGIELVLGAAEQAERSGSPLRFLFVGDGALAALAQRRASAGGNVLYLPAMPRADYLELLGACDLGLVATVPGVSSFAFPSKTVDYLRAALPVAAAVEPGSGYVELLKRYGVGGGAAFGDAAGYLRLAEHLACDADARASARTGARRCLDEVFAVSHAVSALTGAMR